MGEHDSLTTSIFSQKEGLLAMVEEEMGELGISMTTIFFSTFCSR
jgi:hypothetical protein